MERATGSDNYFDEAYFERGWERGTAYSNYRESAASSPIFKQVARAIQTVFSPQLALEMGCATGAIVREMNDLGVVTHGIDISEWAVKNALHPRVCLASAAELPYPDNMFDLVFSSHSLEHLPDGVYPQAFREIDRVSGPDAVQFHMLPIIGTHPYNYDHAAARLDLRKDPTHNILQTMSWWLGQWELLGWDPVPVSLLMPVDTENVELSSGQFCLIRKGNPKFADVLRSINDWNGEVYRRTYTGLQTARAKGSGFTTRITSAGNRQQKSIGPCRSHWDDLKHDLTDAANLEGAEICGVVSLKSAAPQQLRVAFLSDSGDVLEKWLSLEPGVTVFRLDVDDLSLQSGNRNLGSIRKIYFGGVISDFTLSCNLSISGPKVNLMDIFQF